MGKPASVAALECFLNHAFQIFGPRWTIKLAALKLQAVGGDGMRAHMRWVHAHIYTCQTLRSSVYSPHVFACAGIRHTRFEVSG